MSRKNFFALFIGVQSAKPTSLWALKPSAAMLAAIPFRGLWISTPCSNGEADSG